MDGLGLWFSREGGISVIPLTPHYVVNFLSFPVIILFLHRITDDLPKVAEPWRARVTLRGWLDISVQGGNRDLNASRVLAVLGASGSRA